MARRPANRSSAKKPPLAGRVRRKPRIEGRPARTAKVRSSVLKPSKPRPSNLGKKPRAVVLTSGGLDSTVCLAVARKQGYEVYALSFEYGQRHVRELELAREQARIHGAIRHAVVRIGLGEIGGSALTSGELEVPKGAQGDEIPAGIPITYVPARNTVFLSVALGWAEVLEAQAIFIGVNAVDYSGYPDCRPAFLKAFSRLARVATKGGVEGTWNVKIETPLLALTKAEIVSLGQSLGVDFSRTWSCYDPQANAKPCGRCDSCRLRQRGFEQAGIPDPCA